MARVRITASALLAVALVLPTAARADSWGALALDASEAEQSPYFGVGGGATEAEATGNAMAFCKEAGGKDCKPLVTYQQCGALAVSGTGDVGWGKAPTKTTAEAQALAGCQNDKCKILTSDCN